MTEVDSPASPNPSPMTSEPRSTDRWPKRHPEESRRSGRATRQSAATPYSNASTLVKTDQHRPAGKQAASVPIRVADRAPSAHTKTHEFRCPDAVVGCRCYVRAAVPVAQQRHPKPGDLLAPASASAELEQPIHTTASAQNANAATTKNALE
jgi:hypothetical protein